MKVKNRYNGHEFPKRTRIRNPYTTRLAFNFSFLTKDSKYNLDSSSKTINKKVRLKLLDRIYQLSQNDIISVMGYSKEQGFEKISEDNVKISVNSEFKASNRHQECDDGYWVFRLGKLGRVIGKKNDNIFYVLSIDASFDQYDHG